MNEPVIREMTPDDYHKVMELWQSSSEIGLSGSDSQESITGYLGRNPGMSLVACRGEDIVGTVLCGHDGRRGYIHHLVVEDSFRRKGIGEQLVNRCLEKLQAAGIQKCHLFLFNHNHEGRLFWTAAGWTVREDICLMSRDI